MSVINLLWDSAQPKGRDPEEERAMAAFTPDKERLTASLPEEDREALMAAFWDLCDFYELRAFRLGVRLGAALAGELSFQP